MKFNRATMIKIIGLTVVFTLFLTPLAVVVAFELAWKGRIYPGVSAGGINLGGLTPSQAKVVLEEKLTSLPLRIQLQLKNSDQQWLVDLEEVDLNFETEKTAQKALLVGRQLSDPFLALKEKRELIQKGKTLPLDFSWNEKKLDQLIASIAGQLNQKPISTTIRLEDDQIKIQQGRQGRKIQQEGLKNLIKERVASLKLNQPIFIPFTHLGRLPSVEEIEKTIKRAEKLRGKSLVITDTNLNLVLDEAQLISFLDFQGGFNQEKLEKWLAEIKKTVDRPAENALFKFENGKVSLFSPAKKGYSLDEKANLQNLKKKLFQLEEGEKSNLVMELKGEVLLPEIKTADSNQFGISGLVGKGESWFHHSIPSRVANIKLASSKLNGLLIKPGETFSFNQALGEISKKTGYRSAWIIKDGRTVLGDGGGVCQVSTTLFRAALNAGLPIIERHPHSYRVSYYEQNSPVGIDATVFAPSVDFKFKNNYPCHLLIQTKFDAQNYYLAFELYGCPDGRKVVISQPKVWDVVPPPPDLYLDDPSLPAGTIKQVDFRSWGAKASFDWKVIKNGQVIHQQSFYSAYRPWRAVFLRGTGPSP